MRAFSALMAASALAAAAMIAAPASAAAVGDGTLAQVSLTSPTVDLTGTDGTFTENNGMTYEVAGTGQFAQSAGLFGDMNGTISFSKTPGDTTDESLSNFFTFNDGMGGTFDFSVTSVQDLTYVDEPGVTSTISLYILGETTDPFLGLTASETSLTLNFNSNGGSPYAASATLSVPPAASAPEPSTWTLMIGGVALAGAALRFGRRRGALAAA